MIAAWRRTFVSLLAPTLLAITSFASFALLPGQALAWGNTVQGSGKSATENRNVAEFQAINLAGVMDLVVSQGASQSVQVQADDNLIPLLETVVEDSKHGPALQVRWKRGSSINSRNKVLVTVTVPKLAAVAASGSGEVRVDKFNTPSLNVNLAGSGDAQLQGLTTQELTVGLAGSGGVSGNGSANKVKLSIAGSGDIKLAQMKADEVSVSIAGSGGAEVHAEKSLNVSISGSGDVTYTGNAALKSRVAGSGSVSKK